MTCPTHQRSTPVIRHVVGARGRGVATALLVATTGMSAQAQDSAMSDWTFKVAPYLWGAGLSGKAGTFPNLPPAEVDLSFKDILEDLEGAAMIVGHAQNGPWAISADLQHVKTKSTGSVPDDAVDKAEIRSTTQSLSVHLEYNVRSGGGTEVWVSGGARYWNVDTDLTLSNEMGEASRNGSDTWWDPIIGLRGSTPLTENTFFTGWAYIGGFGAGSDFMTDIFAGAGYKFSDRTALVGGLRYQSVDRQSGSFIWDVEQYGPLVGLTFTF